MELTSLMIVAIVVAAFLCEYADSTLGMGYGTMLTPLLILLGFSPAQIVPIVLLSELITGIMAGTFHHLAGNIDFRETRHWQTAVILALCGVGGAFMAASLAVNVPELWVKRYIALLVFGIGVFMVAMRNRRFSFSWRGLIGTGLLASFNKGLSGGGYGPLICSGQIISGISPKPAVAITSAAESLVCLVAFLVYTTIARKTVSWEIAPYVIMGAVLAVPLATKTVQKINEKAFRKVVAIATLILGIFMLWALQG